MDLTPFFLFHGFPHVGIFSNFPNGLSFPTAGSRASAPRSSPPDRYSPDSQAKRCPERGPPGGLSELPTVKTDQRCFKNDEMMMRL